MTPSTIKTLRRVEAAGWGVAVSLIVFQFIFPGLVLGPFIAIAILVILFSLSARFERVEERDRRNHS
jgi:hypothetical protein